MNNPLISFDEAKQLLECDRSNTKLIGVVSDFYNDEVLQQYAHVKPSPSFAILKTEHLEIDQVWKLKPDHDLQAVLTSAGLTPGTKKHILLFDDIQFSCGENTTRFDASARLFAVLRYFGFSKISIILDAEVSASFTDLVASQKNDATDISRPISHTSWLPKHKNTFVKYDELRQVLSGVLGPYRLLDARSAEEFAGVATGYDYVQLAGKIPTAENIINGDYQTSRNESIEPILARLQSTLTEKNINKDDRIIWYCGTAWRASRMFALTLALGYSNVSIYDGGWNEWQGLHPEDATPRAEYLTHRDPASVYANRA